MQKTEAEINPHLQAFGENFQGHAQRELGIFADFVELKLHSSCNYFIIQVREGIDGLREVVMHVVDRAMKGIHCLRFDVREFVVRLT